MTPCEVVSVHPPPHPPYTLRKGVGGRGYSGHQSPRRLPGAESLMRAASAKCTGQPDVVAPAYFTTDQTLVGSCCELVAVSAAVAVLTASDVAPRQTWRPSWLLLLTYFSGFACAYVCVCVSVCDLHRNFPLPQAKILLSITHSPVCPPIPFAPLLCLYFLYHTLVFSPVHPSLLPPTTPPPSVSPPLPCHDFPNHMFCDLCFGETQSKHLLAEPTRSSKSYCKKQGKNMRLALRSLSYAGETEATSWHFDRFNVTSRCIDCFQLII